MAKQVRQHKPTASVQTRQPVPKAASTQDIKHPVIDLRGDALLIACHRLAVEIHKNEKRQNGDPYIVHPEKVYYILDRLGGASRAQLCTALLHDVMESETSLKDTQIFIDLLKIVKDSVVEELGISLDSAQKRQIDADILTIVEGVRQLTNAAKEDMPEGKEVWQVEHVEELDDLFKPIKLIDLVASMIEDLAKPEINDLKFVRNLMHRVKNIAERCVTPDGAKYIRFYKEVDGVYTSYILALSESRRKVKSERHSAEEDYHLSWRDRTGRKGGVQNRGSGREQANFIREGFKLDRTIDKVLRAEGSIDPSVSTVDPLEALYTETIDLAKFYPNRQDSFCHLLSVTVNFSGNEPVVTGYRFASNPAERAYENKLSEEFKQHLQHYNSVHVSLPKEASGVIGRDFGIKPVGEGYLRTLKMPNFCNGAIVRHVMDGKTRDSLLAVVRELEKLYKGVDVLSLPPN